MGEVSRLEAADGLTLVMQSPGVWRIAWGHDDWLGPVGIRVCYGGDVWVGPWPEEETPQGAAALRAEQRSFEGEDDLGPYQAIAFDWDPLSLPLRTSVRAYDRHSVLVFRLEAAAALRGLSTGSFEEPSVAWPWFRPSARTEGGVPKGTRGYGHQYMEFALPTLSSATLANFFLVPERPTIVQPLWVNAPDGRSLLLAPLNAFHEQIIAVPREGEGTELGVRCGWHGDLDSAPAEFASELAVWAGAGPRRVLEAWGSFLQRRWRTERPSRYADDAVGRLSYWTDNGAAYWYRTAPGLDMAGTLERVASTLREQRIPVRAFELDSWFYRHELTRSVGADAPEEVPPTGLIAWEPRADVLPEGIHDLHRRLGGLPLILHGRHFSSSSPYFDRYEAWKDRDRAHPVGPGLLQAFLAQAATWGAIQYEQDWLVESFLGVRGLREQPGRARAWQEGLDRAAKENGLSLLWCMATPADFFQTVTLSSVTSIRASGDYRYRIGSSALWAWFLHTSALARALGLLPFKDVFLSSREGSNLDGDPVAEAEALLAALSAGPVGIGDRIGRTDREVVMRTCRADGLLVKPDVPLAALDRCFLRNAFFEPGPLLGETFSHHPAGRWIYVASFNARQDEEPLRFRLELGDLGEIAPDSPVVAYNWRSGAMERMEPGGGFELALETREWDLRVLCPVLPGEITVLGDVSLYACVGDRRLRWIRSVGPGAVEFDVLGAPGEHVEIHGWSARPLRAVETWAPEDPGTPSWSQDPGTGRWTVPLEIGARGWMRIQVSAGG